MNERLKTFNDKMQKSFDYLKDDGYMCRNICICFHRLYRHDFLILLFYSCIDILDELVGYLLELIVKILDLIL